MQHVQLFGHIQLAIASIVPARMTAAWAPGLEPVALQVKFVSARHMLGTCTSQSDSYEVLNHEFQSRVCSCET